MKVAFYWSPSLILMLLYPDQMSNLVKMVASLTLSMRLDMRGKGYVSLMMFLIKYGFCWCKHQGSLLVKQTLKGAWRMCSKRVCQKKPLPVQDLKSMWMQLEGSSSFDNLLFKAQLNSGFMGLLCLGELFKNKKHALWNWKKITMRHLLKWLPNTYTFSLPCHKGDYGCSWPTMDHAQIHQCAWSSLPSPPPTLVAKWWFDSHLHMVDLPILMIFPRQ